jgi:hypothetical protein
MTSWRGGLGERPPKSRRRQPQDEVGIARTKRFVFYISLYLRFLQLHSNGNMGPSSLSSPGVQGAGAVGAEGSPGTASQKLGAGPGMSGRGWQEHRCAANAANLARSYQARSAHTIAPYRNLKSGDDKLERRPRRAPPPNPDVASLTTRWESRAPKDSFFLFSCTSDSCSAHTIVPCRNPKSGDDKFERRPRRAPPPNLDVASLTMRWKSCAPEDSFFKKKKKPDFPPVGANPTLATLYFRD